MNSRDKIFQNLKKFKNNSQLEIMTFESNYENILEEFITNAKLAGASVYTSVDEIHELKNKHFEDSFYYKSTLGVAENGALWCTDLQEKRDKLFSCNDLIIEVNANDIVSNMHNAYEVLDFTTSTFGTFIAGPSKTADIEQSLVIGAHGAMQLHILILKN